LNHKNEDIDSTSLLISQSTLADMQLTLAPNPKVRALKP